jgi:hypothetical protein
LVQKAVWWSQPFLHIYSQELFQKHNTHPCKYNGKKKGLFRNSQRAVAEERYWMVEPSQPRLTVYNNNGLEINCIHTAQLPFLALYFCVPLAANPVTEVPGEEQTR